MTIAPASLANLCKPWSKGSAPNPDGVPNHGASILSWVNRLGTMSREVIQLVADDETAPVAKRQAAKSLVRALSDDIAKNGRPHAMEDLTFQVEHTNGKATQRVEVVRHEVADPRELQVRLAELVASHPGLMKSLGVGAAEGVGAPIGPSTVDE